MLRIYFFAAGVLAAQVSYKDDIMPLFRANCVGCHGPAQQMAGLRLDRKSSAMKAFTRRIVPGSSSNSFLYHRIAGSELGPQMPPSGPLKPEQIALVKDWIDQGAVWPEALANEVDRPPVDPRAVALIEALRRGDTSSIRRADAALLNARGPEGTTPFQYAVLYGNGPLITQLIQRGADVNQRNDANATALIFAGKDLAKTRALLQAGAEVNAKSDDQRTALMTAARKPGNAATVKLLLEKGANVNPNARPSAESSPLAEAAIAGDAASVELLLAKGADANAVGQLAMYSAVASECFRCLELLAAKISDKAAFTGALQDTAVFGDLRSAQLFLEKGADVNAFDMLGRTPLMYAAISDLLPIELVKLFLAKGADVNAKDKHAKSGDSGLSVLDIAKQNGDTPIVKLLEAAGAKPSGLLRAASKPRQAPGIRQAVQDSLPLIQKADAGFSAKSGCISCHNNSLAAMTMAHVRKLGYTVDEKTASEQVTANVKALEKLRSRLYQGFMFGAGDNFTEFILGYILMGLHAEKHPADLNTDAAALHILGRQRADGQWYVPGADPRPPIGTLYVGQTVISMRALQLYAPNANRADSGSAIRRAAAWLVKARSGNNEDRSWRLKGLVWSGADKAVIRKAMDELLATQRADGGWSDLPSTETTAYATGKSLYALQIAGVPANDPAYQKGVQYLLRSQQEDGSWYTKTRALGFQPYFEAGFPHGYDQWISGAGSSWAAMALATPGIASARSAR